MNKIQFINDLKGKLKKLPKEEVDNAVLYYDEYISDAGVENEGKVIEELGPVSNIASQIIANFAVRDLENKEKTAKKSLSNIWLVILAIFASPIALPISIAIACVIFAIVIVIFSVIFSFAVTGIACTLSGAICTVASITVLIQDFFTGILFIGVGLLTFGIGLLFSIATISVAKKSFSGVANVFGKYILRRTKNEK